MKKFLLSLLGLVAIASADYNYKELEKHQVNSYATASIDKSLLSFKVNCNKSTSGIMKKEVFQLEDGVKYQIYGQLLRKVCKDTISEIAISYKDLNLMLKDINGKFTTYKAFYEDLIPFSVPTAIDIDSERKVERIKLKQTLSIAEIKKVNEDEREYINFEVDYSKIKVINLRVTTNLQNGELIDQQSFTNSVSISSDNKILTLDKNIIIKEPYVVNTYDIDSSKECIDGFVFSKKYKIKTGNSCKLKNVR